MIALKRGVLRLVRDVGIVNDPSGWELNLFGDRIFVVRFGPQWHAHYPHLWLVGIGRRTWWYTAPEETHGDTDRT